MERVKRVLALETRVAKNLGSFYPGLNQTGKFLGGKVENWGRDLGDLPGLILAEQTVIGEEFS